MSFVTNVEKNSLSVIYNKVECSSQVGPFLASSGSTVVEHSPRHTRVKGSSPTAAAGTRSSHIFKVVL